MGVADGFAVTAWVTEHKTTVQEAQQCFLQGSLGKMKRFVIGFKTLGKDVV